MRHRWEYVIGRRSGWQCQTIFDPQDLQKVRLPERCGRQRKFRRIKRNRRQKR